MSRERDGRGSNEDRVVGPLVRTSGSDRACEDLGCALPPDVLHVYLPQVPCSAWFSCENKDNTPSKGGRDGRTDGSVCSLTYVSLKFFSPGPAVLGFLRNEREKIPRESHAMCSHRHAHVHQSVLNAHYSSLYYYDSVLLCDTSRVARAGHCILGERARDSYESECYRRASHTLCAPLAEPVAARGCRCADVRTSAW